MTRIILILLFCLITPPAFANDGTVEKFVQTMILIKQAENNQLQMAINLLSSEKLTDQEKFERIGQPSFLAVEQVLASQGYTIRKFYQFEQDNGVAIGKWLEDNPNQKKQLTQLDIDRESLLGSYDQVAQ